MLHRPNRTVPQYLHRPRSPQAQADVVRAVVKEKTKGFLEQKEALINPKKEEEDKVGL